MILVDDAGGEWPMIGHAPWNGCNLADFVMPFFLFIVGMAIALALKVYVQFLSNLRRRFIGNIWLFICIQVLLFIVQRIPSRPMAIRKVIFRTLKLLFWGLLLQGQFSVLIFSCSGIIKSCNHFMYIYFE